MTRSPLRILGVASAALLFGVACAKKPEASPEAPPSAPASAPAAAAGFEAGPVHRGAAFTLSDETELAKVVAAPADFAGKTVKVSGKVERACAKKGCWMELRAASGETGVRVTFKDYGFFVPLDSAGAEATVEGQVELKTLDADTAAHLEGEGAKITRNAAGEAVEIAMIATGVELRK